MNIVFLGEKARSTNQILNKKNIHEYVKLILLLCHGILPWINPHSLKYYYSLWVVGKSEHNILQSKVWPWKVWRIILLEEALDVILTFLCFPKMKQSVSLIPYLQRIMHNIRKCILVYQNPSLSSIDFINS